MSKPGRSIRISLYRAGKWLRWWVIDDTRERLRGQREKARDWIPKVTALFIERWLGLWFSLLIVSVLGLLSREMYRALMWKRQASILAETVPQLFQVVSVFGLFFTLGSGLLMLGILIVVALRLLRWLRDSILSQWGRRTAPFESNFDTDDWLLEPASASSIQEAEDRAKDQILWGLALLLTVVSALLILEQEQPNLLDSILSDQYITYIGKIIDTAVLGIDVGSLLWMAAPGMTQADLVLIAIIMGIPGIPFLLASRNVLYLVEMWIRKMLIHVRDAGLRTGSAIFVGAATTYFVLTTIVAILQILAGA